MRAGEAQRREGGESTDGGLDAAVDEEGRRVGGDGDAVVGEFDRAAADVGVVRRSGVEGTSRR